MAKEINIKENAVKRGRPRKSTESIYKTVKNTEHLPVNTTKAGFAAEHRYNFYKAHGYLPEIVHHIDGNKENNNPSNLQGMTRSEHNKHHLNTLHTTKDITKALKETLDLYRTKTGEHMVFNIDTLAIHRQAKPTGSFIPIKTDGLADKLKAKGIPTRTAEAYEQLAELTEVFTYLALTEQIVKWDRETIIKLTEHYKRIINEDDFLGVLGQRAF